MPKFIPGLKLSELFYREAVKPIVERAFPTLRYSAALIGWGSEVLGFDTPTSRDHHWGPRVLLFLTKAAYPKLNKKIVKVLADQLPCEFMGYSTNFSKPEPNGVRYPVKIDRGPVNHLVNVYTTRSFFQARLGFDPAQAITPADWLTFSQQRLLELTRGAVFHDGLGDLEKIRRKLSYFPRDVWLYMLAAQWIRISQEEAFVGRAGDVGDDLGSQIVAVRMVREIIKLTFLMERQYAPYSKWLGTAFSKLEISRRLAPVLLQVLRAESWRSREKWLSKAYSLVARRHNSLGITRPLSTMTSNYFERPYSVIHADRFARAIKQRIRSPEVKKLKTNIGSIDQFTDSTNVIEDLELSGKLQTVYE
jgi:Domain of unknown function (DUF4037)